MTEKVLRQETLRREVAVVVGTRPGIVMFAPIIHALHASGLPCRVIHTGQHYSPNMDLDFFRDLNLPAPEHRLENVAEKSTHGGQTAAMLEGIEAILIEKRPALLLVGGGCKHQSGRGSRRQKARYPGRSRGGGRALFRLADAGGAQPADDRSYLRLPVYHFCEGTRPS